LGLFPVGLFPVGLLPGGLLPGGLSSIVSSGWNRVWPFPAYTIEGEIREMNDITDQVGRHSQFGKIAQNESNSQNESNVIARTIAGSYGMEPLQNY